MGKTFVQRTAEDLERLESQTRNTAATSRLNHASLEDTEIVLKDANDQVKGTIGKQVDGSYGTRAVNSDPQPTPTAPIVEPGAAGTMEVTWDGATTDFPVPLVHGHTEVLSAFSETGVQPDLSAYHLASTIRDRKGGATIISCPTPGTWFVRLRMVGQDRETKGAYSAATSVGVTPLVDVADIEARLNAFAEGELPDGAYESLMARLGEFVVVRAGQIETNALDSMVITSPLIQSHATDIGWKHNPNGTSEWHNVATGELNTAVGADGRLFAQGMDANGTIRSGSSEVYASLRPADGQFPFPRLQLRATTGIDPAYLGMGTGGENDNGGLTVLASSRVPGNTRTALSLRQNGGFSLGLTGSTRGIVYDSSGNIRVEATNEVLIQSATDSEVRIRSAATTGGPDGFATGRNSENGLYAKVYARSGASFSPNVYIDPTFGIVYRTSSLAASKVEIDREPEIDLAAIKALCPATFKDRGAVDRGEETPTQIGLIAEDVQALGLGCITTQDGEGQLAGVAYDRVPELLILWLRDQEKRINAQDARQDALEARLAALEGN